MKVQEIGFKRAGPIAMRLATGLIVVSLLALGMLAAPAVSSAGVAIGISVSIAPPPLPVYVQPSCPGPGYIWTPGYWAWDQDYGYYWVPGTWVLAPFIGALWTPGYWGWDDGVYVWYPGYWGPVVGFYGGIDYGFGYIGVGYEGGYWRGGSFYYNRSVNNVSVTNITNVYNRPVSGPVTRTRVSFNGGHGGVALHPTAAQLAAAHERRSGPTAAQRRQMLAARADPKQRVAVNHGRPAVAATPKPGVFKGHGVVQASRAGGPYKAAPAGRIAGQHAPAHVGRPGAIERHPRVAGPEHAAPHGRVERPGAIERHPRVAGPEHAAPRGRVERPGAIERHPRVAGPEHAAPHGRVERPGAIERHPRVAGPEHAAPHGRVERPFAPRNASPGHAFRPGPAPSHQGLAHRPAAPHAAPRRPEGPPKGHA